MRFVKFVKLITLPICLAALMAQQPSVSPEGPEGPKDKWDGWNTHDVPHCSPRPRQGQDSAPCHCLGMVAEVQKSQIDSCYKQAGFDLPEDPKIRGMIIAIAPQSEGLKTCLGGVADHCWVVSQYAHVWNQPHKIQCRTACKPERCGCADSACKPH